MLKGHSQITTAKCYQTHFVGGKTIERLSEGLGLLAISANNALCQSYKLPRKIAGASNG